MIRFSASLVVVGVGLLIAGGVTSRLLLIYIAIGVSALALLFLIVGAILHRAELFGREPEGIAAGQAGHEGYADELGAKPEPAATAVAAGPAPEPARRGSADLSPAQQAFAGYEQFTRQASRRRPEPSREDQPSRPSRPSQPQAKPPFVEPEPTRMDWAAGLREAEKQERERQGPQRPARPDVPAQAKPERAQPSQTRPGQDRPGRDRPGQDRPGQDRPGQDRPGQGQPDRGRPGRGQPGKPFVDPQPTRMDWAAGLREAEQQELGRQVRDKDREATGREPARPGGREPARPGGREPAGPGGREPPRPAGPSRPSGPQRTPEPTRAEATRAERIQQPAEATRAEKVQQPAEATRAEKVQAPRAEPAPAQATRAEKIITAKPDGEATDEDQPAGTPAATPGTTPKAEAKVGEKPSPAQTEAKPGTPPAKEAQEPAEAAEDTKSPAADSDTAETGTTETGTTETGTTKPSAPSASAPAAKTGDTGHGNGHDGAVTDDQNVTVVPGVPRYHRSECILIRFMGDNDLQRMPVEQAREAGCTPCRACQPDGEEDD